MAGSVNYDKSSLAAQKKSILSENEKIIVFSKDYPNCKGLYPDCPEAPGLDISMCRSCPKTDGMKKPRPPGYE